MKSILFFASAIFLNASICVPLSADESVLNQELSGKLRKMRASALNEEDLIILQDGTQIAGHVTSLPKIKFKEDERALNPENLLCIQVGLHEGKAKMQLISKEGKGYLCELPEERFTIVQYFPSLKNPTHKLQQEISAHTISQIIFKRGEDQPIVEEIPLNVIDPQEEAEIRSALEEHKHKETVYRQELSHLREAHEHLNGTLSRKESLYTGQIQQLELAAKTLTAELEEQCVRADALQNQLEQMRQSQNEWKEEYGFFKAAMDQKLEELLALKEAQEELNETLLGELSGLEEEKKQQEAAVEEMSRLNEALAAIQSRYDAEQIVRQQLENQLKILNSHVHQMKQGNAAIAANEDAEQLQQENAQLRALLKSEVEKNGVMKTHLSGVLQKYEQEKAQRQTLEKQLQKEGKNPS